MLPIFAMIASHSRFLKNHGTIAFFKSFSGVKCVVNWTVNFKKFSSANQHHAQYLLHSMGGCEPHGTPEKVKFYLLLDI